MGRDIALLFGFRNEGKFFVFKDGCMEEPLAEDWEKAKQFQNIVVSFARNGMPRVNMEIGPSLDWAQYPKTLDLKSGLPESTPFKEELIHFQTQKKQISLDLNIDTILP